MSGDHTKKIFIELRGPKEENLKRAITKAKKQEAILEFSTVSPIMNSYRLFKILMESEVDFVSKSENVQDIFKSVEVAGHIRRYARWKKNRREYKEREYDKDKMHTLSGLGSMALKSKYNQFAKELKPILAEIEKDGALTYKSIAQQLNDRGIFNRRGNPWSWITVRYMKKRIEELDLDS
ncbi:MAG: hypothetical protein AAF696_17735 [Bacteroidota bacterium]